MRVSQHPILGPPAKRREVEIILDGRPLRALEGEPIAGALIAQGVTTLRKTRLRQEPRGYFCGIGLCTDCMMIVDGKPNTRTCTTPVREGMRIRTQIGLGSEEAR